MLYYKITIEKEVLFRLKKIICIILALVISLSSALYFGVVKFSHENLENLQLGRISHLFTLNQNMALENWNQQDEQTFISSTDDPVIWLDDELNCYVSNIKLSGSLDNYEDTAIRIYYTETPDEEFSEERSFEAAPRKKNSDIYFSVQKNVCRLRLDLYSQAGRTAIIKSVEINPYSLNINSEVAIAAFGIPMLVLSILYLVVFYRDQLKTYFFGLKKYRYLISDLVTRDIKTKYRRSALGVIWSVLNPLLMMLVLTAVFSNIFRFDIKDFPIYYLTGSLIFNFVSEATSFSLTAILGASGLIKKVYIPKYIFPLEKCLFSFVNMLFSFIAVIIVFLILGITPHWSILMFPLPLIYSFVFSLGLGLVLSTLNVFFRDTGHLWSVFVTAWMYVTPIIYPMSILPEWMVNIVKLNPLYYYVEYFRNVMVYGIVPSFTDNMVCITFSVIMLLIGLAVFKKNQDRFILYI